MALRQWRALGRLTARPYLLTRSDALAAGVVGATLMGFDANDVGYLHYCKRPGLRIGELDQIEIVGDATLTECARPFRRHPSMRRQRRWWSRRAERLLP